MTQTILRVQEHYNLKPGEILKKIIYIKLIGSNEAYDKYYLLSKVCRLTVTEGHRMKVKTPTYRPIYAGFFQTKQTSWDDP